MRTFEVVTEQRRAGQRLFASILRARKPKIRFNLLSSLLGCGRFFHLTSPNSGRTTKKAFDCTEFREPSAPMGTHVRRRHRGSGELKVALVSRDRGAHFMIHLFSVRLECRFTSIPAAVHHLQRKGFF